MFARPIKIALLLGLASLSLALANAGEMTLFSHDNFGGREVTLREVTPNLVDVGFNDRASSMVVRSGRWEVCVDSEFRGNCAIFERGEYPTLERFNNAISSAREVGTGHDRGSWRRHEGRRGLIELFAQPGLNGNSTTVLRDTPDFTQIGFNDRAASVRIDDGNWQLCSDVEFGGTCRVFSPGRYNDLGYGLTGRVSSARMVQGEPERERPAPVQLEPGADVTLFQYEGMHGRAAALRADTPDFNALGFNDDAASMVITQGTWEFCNDSYFRGQCRVLGPGQYRELEQVLMRSISSARRVVPVAAPVAGRPEGALELFDAPDFGGARLPLSNNVGTLAPLNFNDRVGSIVIHHGQWEFCEHTNFGGQCVVYGPGQYPRLGGMNNQISSVRRVR